MTHSILRPPAGRTLLLAALMVVALLIGHTGTARALTVTVDGFGTYELSNLSGTFNDNQALLESQPWWTGDGDRNNDAAAVAFRDAAFAASNEPRGTIDNAFGNFYAFTTFTNGSSSDVAYRGILNGDGTFDGATGPGVEQPYVIATEVTPVPEIDGAVLAQLALVLGTLWLVFGVGRRGDGDTPAA